MKRVLPVLAVFVALAGCGSQDEEALRDEKVRRDLMSHVDKVREAGLRRDRPAAETALAELHRSIAAAQSRGDLDTATARTILVATERVAEDVRTMPGPESAPPVTVVVPAPAPDPGAGADEEREDEQKEEEKEQKEEEKEQRKEENSGKDRGGG